MKKLEILNKISSMRVSELLDFVNEYDILYEDYKFYFENLLDEGILETPVEKVCTFLELCDISNFIGDQKKSDIPLTCKFRIEKMDKSILTVEKFTEIYKEDKSKAEKLLYAAMFVDDTLSAYKKTFNI